MTFLVNQDIKHFVENNPTLVSRKDTSYPGVYVLKYKKKVFYDNLWNEYLEECRGTLVDGDYNVISRPFTKIYNYGIEKRAPLLDDSVIVSAFRKVNGFMVAITWYNDDILVSTTGSIDSDYVKMALELIDIIVKFVKTGKVLPLCLSVFIRMIRISSQKKLVCTC